MVSIIYYIVVVMTITEISARPMESDESQKDLENEIPGKMQYKYNIPKDITRGFTITINGTLTKDSTIETLTAILADKGSNRDNDCQIIYDIKSSRLEISPATSPDDQIVDNVPQLHPAFSLKIIARINDNGQAFFGVAINGMNDSLNCKINNLANIGYIVIKDGVENIKNMLFEF